LRDLVVSEYGIADLRGKSDEHVIAQMLSITDSRFQAELLARAKDAGKIAKTMRSRRASRQPPRAYRRRAEATPGSRRLAGLPLRQRFHRGGKTPAPALERLQAASPLDLARLAWFGRAGGEDEAVARMGLTNAYGVTQRFYRALIRGALRA